MSPRQSPAQSFDTPMVERSRPNHLAHQRGQLAGCYTITHICALLHMSRTTFYALQRAGELPFLEEIQPRLGRIVRYRASLVDAYLANQFNRTA